MAILPVVFQLRAVVFSTFFIRKSRNIKKKDLSSELSAVIEEFI